MTYKLKLDIFEGPLDLLLYLVKKNHLDIYNIPIAQVTEQYIQYLELMRLLDLNIAGEFLVMAATLLEIKSRTLLPQPETPPEEEEDPRMDLVRRLLEYQKFKEVAQSLREREFARQQVFTRVNPGTDEENQEIYFEASLFDLISAFSKALKEVPKEIFYEVIKDEFTVEQKIHDILHLLLLEPVVLLQDLFNKSKNKLEIIVSFLAVLELIRLKEINIRQKGIFGAIEILRNQKNIIPYAGRPTKINS